MDKETIDYALQKLNEAFQQIKPGAMDLGQDYINYVVMKQDALFTILILLLISCFFLLLVAVEKELDESTIYCSVAGITIFVILSCVQLYQVIIAHSFPLMYTIDYLR